MSEKMSDLELARTLFVPGVYVMMQEGMTLAEAFDHVEKTLEKIGFTKLSVHLPTLREEMETRQ